jgi:hypothetical protein
MILLLPSLWIYDCTCACELSCFGPGPADSWRWLLLHYSPWPFVCFSTMRCWWASNLVFTPLQSSSQHLDGFVYVACRSIECSCASCLLQPQSVVGRGNNLMYGQDRTACCRTWWISIVSYLATINLTVTLRPPCAHTDPQEPARSHNSTDAYPN